MELRSGIAGFIRVGDPPLPSSDLRAFRSHCFAAARALGGRVTRPGPASPEVGTNFASAVLDLPSGAVAVLVNLHFPVVGMARPWVEGRPGGPLAFVDCGPAAGMFGEWGGYEVASRAELEQPVRPDDLRRLSPAELAQVTYWKPARVGDIVFNF